jgi:hypothetical protein
MAMSSSTCTAGSLNHQSVRQLGMLNLSGKIVDVKPIQSREVASIFGRYHLQGSASTLLQHKTAAPREQLVHVLVNIRRTSCMDGQSFTSRDLKAEHQGSQLSLF